MANSKFDSTHTTQKFHIGTTGALADGSDSPPRLSEALLRAPVTTTAPLLELSASSYTSTMRKVFEHVHGRLEAGLDDAWRSSWGYGGDIEDTPDEKWARQFAEMFVFTAYMGPALSYGGGLADIDYVKRLDYFGEGRKDPAYAIVGACQHLANYQVLTRGYQAEALGPYGLTAGDNSGAPCFKDPAYKGSWTALANGPRNLAALLSSKKLTLTPGSMFCFDGSVHVGGVLRSDLPAGQYQPMDTGVLAGGDETGTADHAAQDKVLSTDASKLIGVGMLNPDPPDAAWFPHLALARRRLCASSGFGGSPRPGSAARGQRPLA